MFFHSDLNDDKVEVQFSPFKGKEKVTLSSPNPTLIATKKQQLEKLIESLQFKDVNFTNGTLTEIEEMVETHSLKIVFSEDSDNKLRVYYKDQSEFQKFESLLKAEETPDITSRETEEKRRIDRRGRTFSETFSEASPASPSSDQEDTEKYKSKLHWKSKTEPSNGSVSSAEKNTFTSSTSLGENITVKDSFTVKGIHVKVYQGSIIKAEVDGIVNAANDRLNNCGGVAEVISKAAGYEMERECRERMGNWHKIRVSENVVTKAGKLKCQWIIHAVGPRWDGYTNKENALMDLYKTVVNILKTASEHGMKSVVMPPISSGIFGVPKEACAAMYVKALLDFAEIPKYEKRLQEFYFVDNKDDILGLISREYQDGLSKGTVYLEPRKVIERLGIASWNVRGQKQGSGTGSTTTANINNYYSRGSQGDSSGNGNNQKASVNNVQNPPIPSTCVKFLKKDAKGSDEYLVGESLKVHIYQGSIIEAMNVSVLVCAEGRDQHGQGFVAKQILEKATKNQKKEISKLFKQAKHLQWSQVLPLNIGFLHYKSVFYAIIKKFSNEKPQSEGLDMLWRTTSNILENANKKKRKAQPLSVAISLLGTGSIKNTEYLQQYADVVSNCILDFSKQIKMDSRLQEIHLVNHNASATEALKRAFAAMQENKQDKPRRRWAPSNVSGNDLKRTQFDPSKYEFEETWNAKKKTEARLEDFIEICTKTRKHKRQDTKKQVNSNQTKENNLAQGNINLINDSSDDEDDKRAEKHQAAAEDTKDGDSDYDNVESDESERFTCVVCMDDEMEDPVLLKKCRHKFCRECIEEYFSKKPTCPVCNTVYGEVFGNQPDGSAKVYKDKTSLPGFKCPTIIIHYDIPNGVQSEEHPNPGVDFTGVSRQGYLPDNKEGRKILGMLKRAFEHRLIFTVGYSRTSGKDNMVTWNDIHHKTRREGGPERYGYPDPEYLERVKDELEAKGITEKSF
ncbi:uncharacterized protein LOC134275882 [Saccostrea cucullata]|uniref:uncharacterized protein LOC134275882 n=1 Tax=Saccostrea cuccullata TaxID=36930 RepID=UPI002ED4F86C